MKFNKKLLTTLAVAGATIGFGTAAANADTVTVQSGDTVSEIAQKYNTTVDDIQQENHLSNPNMIYVGQRLQVNGNEQYTQVVLPTTQTVQNNTVSTTQKTTNDDNNLSKSVETEAPVATKPIVSKNDTSVTPSQTTNSTSNNNVSSSQNSYNSNVAGNDADAKAWIAQRESGNNYGARNGQYVGKYQLSASYLNGDYSPANQEKAADNYVSQRYGSWSNAKAHWEANGWY